jgi:hypothetical protein
VSILFLSSEESAAAKAHLDEVRKKRRERQAKKKFLNYQV